jgi:phage-related protein
MSDFVDGWCPTPPLQVQKTWRMNIAQFGDGYEQRQLDGINALQRTWSVSYAIRDQFVILAMDAYLIAHKGGGFGFRDPVTAFVHVVTCDEWSIDWNLIRWGASGDRLVYGTLSAEFRKLYGEVVEGVPASPGLLEAALVTSSDGLRFEYVPGVWSRAMQVGHEWLVDGAPTGERGWAFDAPGPGHTVTVRETAINRIGVTSAYSSWTPPLLLEEAV